MSDFAANSGLNNMANKQYGLMKQAQNRQNIAEKQDTLSTSKEKGQLSQQQVVDMANPNVDKYIAQMGMTEEVSRNRKKYNQNPSIDALKERFEKALTERYDNAHNMLAEAFYGFQVSTCSSLMGMLGADPAELDAIKRKSYEEAKDKVQAGFERLASAFAEYDIYAA